MAPNFFTMEFYKEIIGKWPFDSQSFSFNPLLHRLFLGHDIIFYFLDNIEKVQENFKLVLNAFENMENGAFAFLEQMFHFP